MESSHSVGSQSSVASARHPFPSVNKAKVSAAIAGLVLGILGCIYGGKTDCAEVVYTASALSFAAVLALAVYNRQGIINFIKQALKSMKKEEPEPLLFSSDCEDQVEEAPPTAPKISLIKKEMHLSWNGKEFSIPNTDASRAWTRTYTDGLSAKGVDFDVAKASAIVAYSKLMLLAKDAPALTTVTDASKPIIIEGEGFITLSWGQHQLSVAVTAKDRDFISKRAYWINHDSREPLDENIARAKAIVEFSKRGGI